MLLLLKIASAVGVEPRALPQAVCLHHGNYMAMISIVPWPLLRFK
jgi:hypothetical protein